MTCFLRLSAETVAFVLIFAVSSFSASFSCVNAVRPDKKAICADALLSQRDEQLAAAFIKASAAIGKEQARMISRPLIARLRQCGTDPQCIGAIQIQTIGALNAVTTARDPNPVIAEPTAPQPEQGVAFVPYGSRPGMTVQIVDRWGIGSERAVLFIRHTHQDAVDFCTGYAKDPSPQCIKEELAVPLKRIMTANCKTGLFTAADGSVLLLDTTDQSTESGHPTIRDFKTSEILGHDLASGHDVYFRQYQAMCPASANRVVAAQPSVQPDTKPAPEPIPVTSIVQTKSPAAILISPSPATAATRAPDIGNKF